MKAKLFLLFALITINSFGAVKHLLDFSLGATNMNMPILGSSSTGLNMGMTIFKVYFDISTNLVKGKGTELNFSSNQTYDSGKTNATVFNLGYQVVVNDKLSFTPYLGMGTTANIYEDPILFDSYFKGNEKSSFNAGVISKFFFNEYVGVFLGIGRLERFKFGLTFIM